MSPTKFVLLALFVGVVLSVGLVLLGFDYSSGRLLVLPLFIAIMTIANRILGRRQQRRAPSGEATETSLRSLFAMPAGARAYFRPWKQYANSSGRATPEEFWYFTLLNGLALGLLGRFAGVHVAVAAVWATLALAAFLPGIAVAVRRVHDTDTSGKYLLLGLFPFVGAWVLFLKLLEAGTPGDNRFGPNPNGNPEVSEPTGETVPAELSQNSPGQ